MAMHACHMGGVLEYSTNTLEISFVCEAMYCSQQLTPVILTSTQTQAAQDCTFNFNFRWMLQILQLPANPVPGRPKQARVDYIRGR